MMPALFIARTMRAGNVIWRPKTSEGLTDDGPPDKRLIIQFHGRRAPGWVKVTSYGYAVDIGALAAETPSLFDKKWLHGRGLTRAVVSRSADALSFDIQL
jgi:hypothetical protein